MRRLATTTTALLALLAVATHARAECVTVPALPGSKPVTAKQFLGDADLVFSGTLTRTWSGDLIAAPKRVRLHGPTRSTATRQTTGWWRRMVAALWLPSVWGLGWKTRPKCFGSSSFFMMKSVPGQLAGTLLFAALLGFFYRFIAGAKAVVWWALIASVGLVVGLADWLFTYYRPTFEVAGSSTGTTAPPIVGIDMLTTFAVIAGLVSLILFGARRLARAFA